MRRLSLLGRQYCQQLSLELLQTFILLSAFQGYFMDALFLYSYLFPDEETQSLRQFAPRLNESEQAMKDYGLQRLPNPLEKQDKSLF